MLLGLYKSAVEPGGGSPPPPASGVPGSPPAGAPAGSPPAGTIDWNTAPQQLRDAYQRTQTEYQQTKTDRDEWAKLGNRDDVSRAHQTFTKIVTEATSLGQQLGYDAQELQQAIDSDPAGTLAFLRQTARQTPPGDKPLTQADIDKLVERKLGNRLKPFEQERELQLDQKAESAFNGEFDRQFKTSFPNGLPDSNKEAISGLAWALLNQNPDAYKALRGKGDTSNIQAAFEQAKKTFLKVITDYGEHEKTRVRPPAEAPQVGKKKDQTLDDMISRLGDRRIPDSEVFAR